MRSTDRQLFCAKSTAIVPGSSTAEVPVFSLRLLGGLTLEGPSGPVSGRVAQRRRLGLLALLGVAGEKGLAPFLVGVLGALHEL